MGYKDKARQNSYQVRWYKARRDQWIQEHGPCVQCGSWEELEFLRPKNEGRLSHQVWSWTPERRNAALAQAKVYCRSCATIEKGMRNNWWMARVPKEGIVEIRTHRLSQREYAAKYGVHKASIEKIQAHLD